VLDTKKIHSVFARTCPNEAQARLDLPAPLKGMAYRGVWRIPVPPYRPLVHVFSDAYNAADLWDAGWDQLRPPSEGS
jgi:hypothetical protein